MFPAAKWLDPVVGVDIHLVLVPAPPAPPIPTPLPHPFVGLVFDPMGAAVGAAIGRVFGGGGPVLVNGLPVGNTGTHVKVLSPHLPTPPGISFAPADVPGNEGVIVTGSKTVHMVGASEGRLTSLVMSCNFPINLPTSVCLAVPMGPPVLIGGPTAMDWLAAAMQAIRTKWVSDKLHQIFKLKPGSWASKIVCFLTGHPVDVISGQVITDGTDFELPGPIPLKFERNYYSRSRHTGPLGPGWHHPLDAGLDEDEWGLSVRLPDGRPERHLPLAPGESRWDEVERYTLEHAPDGSYRLTYWDGRCLHFGRVQGARDSHPLQRISDRCGNQIRLSYEGGRLTQAVDSAGRLLIFESDWQGRLCRIRLRGRQTDSLYELVQYEYDQEGRLAAVIDPLGHPFRYAYRGGVLVKETNRNGLSFYFEYDWYDPDGWCVRTWGDGGIYDRRLIYDKHRHVTVVEDSRGGRTIYFGNAAGLVDRKIDASGGESRYEWDECCRQTAEVDPLGHRTEWTYDQRGNRLNERNALGQQTCWRYGPLDLAIEKIDAAGYRWRREYDPRGNLVRSENPQGDAYEYAHDQQGNIVFALDPLGRRRRAVFDTAGQLIASTDWEGHESRFEYDDLGRLCSQIGPDEGQISLHFSGSHLAGLTWPDGSTISNLLDPEGNILEHIDVQGSISRYQYGGLNKLIYWQEPEGASFVCVYDSEENLIELVKADGANCKFNYDRCGRLVEERGFDGRMQRFRYDRAGRCVGLQNGLGQWVEVVRDALGRVVRRMADAEATSFEYDALGRVLKASNPYAQLSYKRDAVGRVQEERADDVRLERRYDAAGNLNLLKTSLGYEAAYEFGAEGKLHRLVAAAPAAPLEVRLHYDADGREVERQLPGQITSQWTYDLNGRPRSHQVLHSQKEISATTYEWRSPEQLAAISDTHRGTTHFAHDARSYLVTAQRPDGEVQHRFADAAGNLIGGRAGERTYGSGGQLLAMGNTRFVYDADGRLVRKLTPDGEWGYGWDAEGRLRKVTRPDGREVTLSYDPFGRRIKKTIDAHTTSYIWDSDTLIHELDGSVVSWIFDPASANLLARQESGRSLGVVTDHVGAPQILIDPLGQVAWEGELDLYGVPRTDSVYTCCPWRWPGQYADKETNLYYNRSRYYDPGTGNYISPDPLGLLGGISPYAYVKDPHVWIDPWGLQGIIYLRTNVVTGAEYVGRSRSMTTYLRRQAAHSRLLSSLFPGQTYQFNILQQGPAGTALRVAEEDWIRAGGGPGALENARFEINDGDYRANGGCVAK